MDRRLELHEELVKILGSRNVYFQPPETLKMEYPCIRYDISTIKVNHADNIKYLNTDAYELIYISRFPDNDKLKKLLELPLTSFSRHYISDNLHHNVIRIYY